MEFQKGNKINLGKISHRRGISLEEEYGKERAENIRKKQSEHNRNRWKNPEFREKMTKKLKTRDVYWKDKISNATRGEKNPFYGKHHKEKTKKELEEKIYSKRRGKTYEEFYGEDKTKEIKEKQTKKEHTNLGKKFPKELYPNFGWRTSRKNQIFPVKDTSIEKKIQNFLKQLGIEFLTHQYIKDIEHGYQCDIFIPSIKLVIECDGDYWHKYPTGTDLDHIKTSELLKEGFKVLRLWEHEIESMNISDLKNKLEEGGNAHEKINKESFIYK